MALDKHKGQPRAEDYPSSDGVPMDNEQHAVNIRAWLIDPFGLWCERTGFAAFAGGNSFVYYGPRIKHDVVGPDLYIVNGGVHRGQEKWIIALEGGLKPTLVMEFMSDTTRKYDQDGKLALYRDKVGVLDYFVVDNGPVVRGYHLHGSEYVPVLPDADGRIACSSLPLKVGIHDGWVRWFDLDGNLLPTRGEYGEQRAEEALAQAATERAQAQAERAKAEAERAKAEAERAKAEAERQRANELARELEALKARLDRSNG